MLAVIGSRLIILVFGTLYPAYASYKAVRNKDVKAYVQWMMYWIVFALFTCAETFSDVFLSFWVPFYYEIKVIIVIWLLSPATKGSSLLYRKFVHPTLTEREKEIDEYLAKMREKSYSTMLELGSKGINYALQTAIKGGGGLVSQLRKSYSLSDLSDKTDGPGVEQDLTRPRAQRVIHPINPEDSDDMDEVGGVSHRGYSPRRSASGSGRMEMYFPAVDVEVRQRGVGAPAKNTAPLSDDAGFSGDSMEVDGEPLVRTASLSSTRTSTRLRRPANPALATTPSGRKSVASVAEAMEAVVESSPLPSDSLPSTCSDPEQSETETSTSEQNTVIESLAKDTDVFEEAVEGVTVEIPPKEIELKVATISHTELASFELEETQNLLNEIENIKPECIEAEIVSFLDECESKLCEVIDQNDEQELFMDTDENTETNSKVELFVDTDENTETNSKVEVAPTDEVKKVEDSVETKVEEVSKDININKASQNVLVTVEVSMPQSLDKKQSGSMLVRLSMESLPTSSKSADNLQREIETDPMIPEAVETYQDKDRETLQSSTDSLASCSLPSTPNVSRSNSSMSEARAGKYNKLPAPPRPESPSDEDAVKARLVLKPGMVRNLPEGESSQVFLSAPPRSKDKKVSDGKKKHAHRSGSGLSSIFPFWLTKPQDKKDDDDKKTVPMKAKMTDL